MGKLNTDFKDDILSEKMNGKKRVKLIPQEDGTYILEDVTEYTQTGSSYGQKEINLLNSTVNGKLDVEKVIDDLGTALAVTEEGVPVGCKAISALNSNLSDSLGGITFGVDDDGNYGYIKAGADTVTPFKTEATKIYGSASGNNSWTVNIKRNAPILKLTGEGYIGNAPTNHVALGIYGAAEDYVTPYTAYNHVELPIIQAISIYADMPTVEIDVSAYPRLVIYAIYGTATVNSTTRINFLIEN